MYKQYNQDTKTRKRNLWNIRVLFTIICIFFLFPACTTNNAPIQAQEVESEKDLQELFDDIYVKIRDEYVDETTARSLLLAAIQGMLESLNDPYSQFLDIEELTELKTSTSGVFGGVGMYIDKHRSDNVEEQFLEVVSPIEGTPAFYAGMRSGDLIVSIEGESTQPMSSAEAAALLRGEPGTMVTIQVQRGSRSSFEVSLTRELITVPATRSGIIEDDIAYIRLILFSEYTALSFEEFFENEYREDSMQGLIIDLRGNGGGLLSAANKMVDYFFDDGVMVSLKGRTKNRDMVYHASKQQLVPDSVPIVVLIDAATASASEILAGALKDRKRATIIGTTSYGKGSIQEVITFGEEGIRLTTARYYTPSGESLDTVGIDPDIEAVQPDISDAETEAFQDLISSGVLSSFAKSNPDATEAEQISFIRELAADYTPTTEWYIRRFLRAELHRANENTRMLVDLEYDVVLQRALEFLRMQ